MSTSQPTACPRCRKVVRARGLGRHVQHCWHPRTLERLFEILRVEPQPNGCWFTRGRSPTGDYVDRPKVQVTRVERWIIVLRDGVEMTDPDTVALHSCDEPRCVNPDHIRAGTRGENFQDALDRGRVPLDEERYRRAVETRRRRDPDYNTNLRGKKRTAEQRERIAEGARRREAEKRDVRE